MATEITSAALEKDAGAYLDERLASASDPAFASRLLIGNRDFVLKLMAGFAAVIVARELIDLMTGDQT